MKLLSLLFMMVMLMPFANSQTIPNVTPANTTQVAQQIYDLYNELPAFDATPQEIKLFLDSHFTTNYPYSELCDAPDASVDDLDDDTASFSWPDIPGNVKYRARYLNLKTNAMGASSTSFPAVSFNIPNALYLFTFQSKCGPKVSALDIIIVDKPVVMTIFPDDALFCNCRKKSDLISEGSNTGGNNIFTILSHSWNAAPNSSHFYDVNISYNEQGPSWQTHFYMRVYFGNSASEIDSIRVNPHCIENLYIEDGGGLVWSKHPSSTFGSPNFESLMGFQGQFLFNPSTFIDSGEFFSQLSWYMSLKRCHIKNYADPRSEEEEESLSQKMDTALRATPNPSGDYTLITYNQTTDEPVTLKLYNDFGQLVKVLQTPIDRGIGQHEYYLQWGELPAGSYLCQLQSSNIPQVIRIVRLP